MAVAVCGGLAMAGGVTWLFVSPSGAPARAPASQHLAAPASKLAVIDGETLRIGDDVVRLAGIAAPRRDTRCEVRGGVSQDCGVAAANALAALVRRGPIECTIHGRDSRGRPLGDCQTAGVSLSQAQVRDGWAVAREVSLKDMEAEARSAGRGVWRNGGDS
ncbi:MAG TPA: thermonuclease family protein [Rhodopila sp.]|nr:thermonuclease family protein [Rhodopila sp.]